VSVTLIGPGGAGKSTVGRLLAERLRMPFVDLDQRFADRAGDISEYINRFGYGAYARENVEIYNAVLHQGNGTFVAALSSGFMTYPRDIHPHYAGIRKQIEDCPTTFVLLPSLTVETCVAEIVRRQLARPFARSAATEERVIRERFPLYAGLRVRKIETMRPLAAILDDLYDTLATSSSRIVRTSGAVAVDSSVMRRLAGSDRSSLPSLSTPSAVIAR